MISGGVPTIQLLQLVTFKTHMSTVSYLMNKDMKFTMKITHYTLSLTLAQQVFSSQFFTMKVLSEASSSMLVLMIGNLENTPFTHHALIRAKCRAFTFK